MKLYIFDKMHKIQRTGTYSVSRPTYFSDPRFLNCLNLPPGALPALQREHEKTHISHQCLLLEMGFIEKKALSHLLENFYQKKSLPLDQLLQHPPTLLSLPFMEKLKVILMEKKVARMDIAMVNPHDSAARTQLQAHLPHVHIRRTFLCLEIDFYQYLATQKQKEQQKSEQRAHMVHGTAPHASSPRFLDTLLAQSVQQKVSDLHFMPQQNHVVIKKRIQGLLTLADVFHMDFWETLRNRIKVLASLNIAELRKPQSGAFQKTVLGHPVDFRASTHPTLWGESLVIRILDDRMMLQYMTNLGLFPAEEQLLQKSLTYPHGLIILTGPTGSGKTTTLYALLHTLRHKQLNIMTLEDPIEYKIPGIRQTPIHYGGPLNFAEGIKSILRHDPDVLFIGEIRDEETAHMALQASMTGHLVLTTLHTSHAISALPRLENLGLSRDLLLPNLRLIAAQRLLRQLCTKCCQKRPLKTQEERDFFLESPFKSITDTFHPKGCADCDQQGYSRRFCVAEVLPFFAPTATPLPAPKKKQYTPYRACNMPAYTSLRQNVQRAVSAGRTSLDEAIRTIGYRDAEHG
jgi:type IV pilus assembly protein PilB